MSRNIKRVHVVEPPLIIHESDRHALEKRFKAAGILKNICTGETVRRLAGMRGSEDSAHHIMVKASLTPNKKNNRRY